MRIVFGLVAVIAAALAHADYKDPHCRPGRTVITHLFEWRWDDIAQECERFLGPHGYCGVQISPPSENAIVTSPYRPWWERYQPVSYRLVTRSGDEAALRNMITRCNKVGVRVYADAVINHMTGAEGRGTGTGGTPWNGRSLRYPGVPYQPEDFNDRTDCHSADGIVHNYGDAQEVRNCKLVNLADLALDGHYVRTKVSGYLNHLIDLGVAGFRVDAAKHMWPSDLRAIFARLKNLRQDIFGPFKRPFILQEVIDEGGEAVTGDEYLSTGRITNFKYGIQLEKVFRRTNTLRSLSTIGRSFGSWTSDNVVSFIDNHDNQRGEGAGGSVLTHKDHRLYKMATAFMLAHPYGFPRVMSSFQFFTANQGPPNHNGNISRVIVEPDMTCSGGWVCEHRWRQIYNMVAFRNVAGSAPLTNWWAGSDFQVAFSRGNKAFLALNLQGRELNARLQTGLPQGTYCDVISGTMAGGRRCTGASVRVEDDGRALIRVCSDCEDSMLAIHVGAKVGSVLRRNG